MNNVTIESYFKSLCNEYYIAYKQVKYLKKEDEEYIKLRSKIENILDEIANIIKTIQEDNNKIIITSKAEIYSLIAFFAKQGEIVNIVNTDGKFKEVFSGEKDLYEEFIEAYLFDDFEGILDIEPTY